MRDKSALPLLPAGLTLRQFDVSSPEMGMQCRTFCLDMVKETYGFDYNPDWHADLDSLTKGDESHYSVKNRGCFIVAQGSQGEIVGTIGLRSLEWRKNLTEKFKGRYAQPERVGSLWRAYLSPRYQRQALGQVMVALCEQAERYGYDSLYLHSEVGATGLREYWSGLDFGNFCNDEVSAHFDKPLNVRGMAVGRLAA